MAQQDIRSAFVGIDQSLNSTAVCVELTDGSEFFMNFAKVDKLSQWMKRTTDVVYYSQHSFTKVSTYSESEVSKVKEYTALAIKIACKIAERKTGNINDISYDGLRGVPVAIEGYSYGSSAGPLIDLVTFGSRLRKELIDRGAELHVISPMALKVACCKLSYGVDKKGVARNDIGLAGGKFTKSEMFRAMYQYEVDNPLKRVLSSWKDDIYKMKNIPKPFDDLVDAYFLKEAIKHKINEGLDEDDI